MCAVCPRLKRCRVFPIWYRTHKREYLDFVSQITTKFPEKYTMEVIFMAEKQNFVQIVDNQSGKIEKIINLSEIEAMTAEEKLALSRNKSLFIVTHRLEPVVKIELKKTVVNHEIVFAGDKEPVAEPITPIEEAPPVKTPKGRKGKS
ncbi:MAG: hypothetical protein CVU49_08250 [Candidatus Cloacimonetes bacterium HGW-Cloacimonetes-2]|nr:MAG: hypothetical protein CVU49_08250 [Candidatus Cloacimonetes bacterium HGW-Cloacimonetes-2]